jgi:hypothetical protein
MASSEAEPSTPQNAEKPSIGNLIRQLQIVDSFPLEASKRESFIAAIQLTIDGVSYQQFGGRS